MYINLLAAVAVTSVMGGQAGAATYTVAEYDMQVRYEGTGFTEVDFFPLSHDYYSYRGDVPAGDTSLGLKSYLFGAQEIGTVLQFRLKLVHPHAPISELYYGNGGRAPICQLGPWDCTAVNMTDLQGDSAIFALDDQFWVYMNFMVGSVFDVGFWSTYASQDGPFVTTDGLHGYSYRDEYSQFTILDIKDLAPVPLPSAIALLPLGIGSLAFMRKRRRRAAD